MPVAFHEPVLADEVCAALTPSFEPQPAEAGVLVDATCGGGGHTLALLSVTRPRAVVLMDRDPEALTYAAERLRDAPCPTRFVHAPFSTVSEVLAEEGIREVSAILADLGLSSHQLDTPSRGFSFMGEGPLDMRMDPSQGMTAAELIDTLDGAGLAAILREYGEEPDARRIAQAIVAGRPRSTRALADIVSEAMSARQRRQLGKRIHPATRTFMALRVYLNRELEELDAFLDTAPDLLVVGGRLAVISFHSLEDRKVKRRMQTLSSAARLPPHLPVRERELPRPRFQVPRGYKRGKTAADPEVAGNPRARSARLRVLERIQA